MGCTTLLVGRDASYDGSTIIARNEDSCNGEFDPKQFIIVKPQQPAAQLPRGDLACADRAAR